MTLALDGSIFGVNFAGSSQAVQLTTSNPNDVIIVDILTTGGPVSSVTASGLTFAQRASAYWSSPLSGMERWYAVSGGVLSSLSITVDTAVASFLGVLAYGVSGANTSSPFQVSSVTGENGSGGVDPLSISPTGNAFVTAFYGGSSTSTYTPGSGFADVSGGTSQFCIAEYQIPKVLR